MQNFGTWSSKKKKKNVANYKTQLSAVMEAKLKISFVHMINTRNQRLWEVSKPVHDNKYAIPISLHAPQHSDLNSRTELLSSLWKPFIVSTWLCAGIISPMHNFLVAKHGGNHPILEGVKHATQRHPKKKKKIVSRWSTKGVPEKNWCMRKRMYYKIGYSANSGALKELHHNLLTSKPIIT